MSAYTPTQVKVGPGTLYAAPLGTAEPTGVSGAWPTGWTALGYTTKGSTFEFQPTLAAVEVEEEYWPVRNVIEKYSGKFTFVLAQTTRQNLMLALNNGIGTSVNATNEGTTGPFLWAEPPNPGTEKSIMLGWDSLPEGATSGTTPFGRFVARSCIQGGPIKMTHQKGATKTTYSVEFMLQKPAGKAPFRMWFPPSMAA